MLNCYFSSTFMYSSNTFVVYFTANAIQRQMKVAEAMVTPIKQQEWDIVPLHHSEHQ